LWQIWFPQTSEGAEEKHKYIICQRYRAVRIEIVPSTSDCVRREELHRLSIPSVTRMTPSTTPHLIVAPIGILNTMNSRLRMRLNNRWVRGVVVVEIVGLVVVTGLWLLIVVVVELLSASKVGAVESHWDGCGIVSWRDRMGEDGRRVGSGSFLVVSDRRVNVG
jgi:hypothetical protein